MPRAVFSIQGSYAEVWCISDLLEHLPDDNKFQSSTAQKAKYLPKIFRGEEPGLVIAVGTAGLPEETSENGSVVTGTKCFVHNAYAGGTNFDSDWRVGPFDTIIDSSISEVAFRELVNLDQAPSRFLVPPLNPGSQLRVLGDHCFVALSGVNVTEYSEYTQADAATLDAFVQAKSGLPAKSLETTHGLIRVQSLAPFLFVSGITDRVGHFDTEVQPRSYAQNTVAAHNAGVALGNLLVNLNALMSKGMTNLH